VLLTGHSLGGGVAAVLAVLLLEQRQQWQQQQQWRQQQQQQQHLGPELELLPESTRLGPAQGQQQQQQQDELWSQLGELRCVGVGAAAAFCQMLGMACKQHVTSILYG